MVVAAENPKGATVFKDLVADPPTSEPEFIVLWKLYIITLIAQQFREYGIVGPKANVVFRALEDARLLEKDFSLVSILRGVYDYARKLVKAEALEGGLTFDPGTGLPNGVTGRIVLREPTAEQKKLGARGQA